MAEIRDFFIKSLDEAECGINGMMSKLGEQLKNRDHPVWFQLQQQELCPQYYSFRYASFCCIYVVMFVVFVTPNYCVCYCHDSYGCVFLLSLKLLCFFHHYHLPTLTEVFPCFSSVLRQMPGLNSQSRGTDRISSELSFVFCLSLCYAMVFMLFCCYYVVLFLCCSVIICVFLCIDRVYCTTATGC